MRARGLFLFVPLLLSVGCGTLYNKQRSDTATEAQKKFTGVNLAELLKNERAHNAELLTREITIAKRQAAATRDAKMIALLSSADVNKALETELTKRLTELRGDDQQIVNLLIRIANGEEGLRFAQDLYRIRRTASDPKVACSGADAKVSERARDDWDDLQDRCTALDELRGQLATHAKSGLLGATAAKIATTERARNELAKQLARTETDARTAAATLAAAQKPGRLLLDSKALEKLKTTVTKLDIPSAEQLSNAGIDDVRAAAALRWVEIQRAAVDKLLAAATSGATEPPPGTADALQIAAVLPSLAAQLQQGFRYPRVSALVMESQRLRIDADRYRKQLARVDEELALHRAQLVRLRAETSTISDGLSKLTGNDFDGALERYAESWTVWRIPMKETEWKLIGLTHERALDQSEAAIAQWEALVRTPLAALVASVGSGLTPEEIAGLMHAIELGALAAGI